MEDGLSSDDVETDDYLESFARQWEKDFDKLNDDPENNSDFDSDNDINPLDSVNTVTGQYFSSQKNQQISANNIMLKKPI